MKKLINKLMLKLGYVPLNDLKEILYREAIDSYQTDRTKRGITIHYKYEITVIDTWRNFLH